MAQTKEELAAVARAVQDDVLIFGTGFSRRRKDGTVEHIPVSEVEVFSHIPAAEAPVEHFLDGSCWCEPVVQGNVVKHKGV